MRLHNEALASSRSAAATRTLGTSFEDGQPKRRDLIRRCSHQ